MSLILHFGTAVLGPARTLAVSREFAAPDTIERWRVELELAAATPAALEPVLTTIRTLQGATAPLQLLHDGAAVRVLALADCRKGPLLEAIREHDPAPGEAHNSRRLTLDFHAIMQGPSAVQAHALVVKVAITAGEPVRLVTTGRAVLRSGEDPATHEAALLPAPAPGHRRVRQAVARDAVAPTLEYETHDEQVFTTLPAGVEDGHYVISEQMTTDGRALRVVSGFFIGAGAKSRALELRPANERITSCRVSENPFTRRVDFEFVELADQTGALALTESLSFTTTRRVVDHPLLYAALPAYRQQIGSPQTEVIQEGSAIGNGRHAAPPAPRFGADLIERRVHYSLPHPGLPAERRWVTTWRYVSRGRSAIFPEI
jgi:hypothetical protein